jgi:hypothetical protein
MSEPTKKEIVGLVEAQASTVESISERLVKIENLVEKQDSKNQNVIYAVLLAAVFIVVAVSSEVVISNKNDSQFYSQLEKDVYTQDLKTQGLINQLDNLKVRNPYLK